MALMNRWFPHDAWPDFEELDAYETYFEVASPALMHRLNELHCLMGKLVTYQGEVDLLFEDIGHKLVCPSWHMWKAPLDRGEGLAQETWCSEA